MPANIGRIVQLHTARTVPDTDAIPYDVVFFVSGLKYFRIASFWMKAAMAPAIKNAGMRQVTTCSDKYSSRVVQPSRSEPMMGSVIAVSHTSGGEKVASRRSPSAPASTRCTLSAGMTAATPGRYGIVCPSSRQEPLPASTS